MPHEDIVFQLKLLNVGVGPATFRVFTDLRKNVGNLDVKLNGGSLSLPQQYDKLDLNEEVKTTLTISRGPLLYKYPPIDFQLFSGECTKPNACACEEPQLTTAKKKIGAKSLSDLPIEVLDGD